MSNCDCPSARVLLDCRRLGTLLRETTKSHKDDTAAADVKKQGFLPRSACEAGVGCSVALHRRAACSNVPALTRTAWGEHGIAHSPVPATPDSNLSTPFEGLLSRGVQGSSLPGADRGRKPRAFRQPGVPVWATAVQVSSFCQPSNAKPPANFLSVMLVKGIENGNGAPSLETRVCLRRKCGSPSETLLPLRRVRLFAVAVRHARSSAAVTRDTFIPSCSWEPLP